MSQGGPQSPRSRNRKCSALASRAALSTPSGRGSFCPPSSFSTGRIGFATFGRIHQPPGIEAARASAAGRSIPRSRRAGRANPS